jgi:hypothetical protein
MVDDVSRGKCPEQSDKCCEPACTQESESTVAGVKRARVYFDIAPFGTNPGGRLVFELYNDIVAATAENFRQLCTGEHGVGKGGTPLTYKGASL